MHFSVLLGLGAFASCFQSFVSASTPALAHLDKREPDLISTIVQDIESATTCAGCEALLVLLKAIADLGNGPFVSTITAVCEVLGIEDKDVCEGAIGLEGPILAHDLREMTIGSHTSQLFCSTIFGLCDFPAVTPYTVPFPSPKPATPRPGVSGQTPIQIVHISDIHVDLEYEVGASYNCTKPICCRPYTTADEPGNNDTPAQPFGNANCDTPQSLEKSMYAAIESLVPNAAFTMFTGDIVEGAVWLVNQANVTEDITSAYTDMSGLNLVYGTLGNHEAAPVNSYPPAAISTTMSSQWVYDAVSSFWSTWIGTASTKTAESFGAYSTKFPGGNLRMISINTNLYHKNNFWLYENTMETDPSGQLAWLVGELKAAETAGERVYIISHIPMGSGDIFHDASNYFDQIVQRYSSTIAALFFGHTHRDEFQLAYTDYTAPTYANAVTTSYIAPALTPTSGNPAFRIYTVDPVTFAVLDSTTYYANTSAPNYQTTGPVWEKLYSAKETYGPLLTPPLTDPTAELTPAFWHNLTAVFETSDDVFAAYMARKTRGAPAASCTGACKTSEICQLRAAQSQYNCFELKPGVNFRKREEGGGEGGKVHGHGHGDGLSECGGSVAAGILAGLGKDVPALRREVARRGIVL